MSEEDGSIESAASKIHGILNPPAAPEPNDQETQDQETQDTVETPEPVDSEEPTEARTEEAEQEAEEQTIEAEDFAKLLNIGNDKLVVEDGEVKFRVNVDGEESDATLNDLFERYQRDASLTNRSKKVADLEKKAEAQLSDLVQRSEQMAQQTEAFYQALEKEVLSPYESINWNELRVDDPAEYAAKRAEFSDLKQRLNDKRSEVMNGIAKEWQEGQVKIQEQFKAYLDEQRGLLKSYIPNWSELTQKEVTNFLKSEGFSEEEVSRVSDARLVKLAHMAMQFTKGKTNVTKKLEKTLPKVLKPGTKPSAKAIEGDKLRKAKEQLKKDGSLDSAIAVLKQRRLAQEK